MYCTYACAGEHCIARLGNHWHVNADPVAFLNAARFECVGKPADRFMQRLVGDVSIVIGVVAFPNNRCLRRAML